MRDDPTATPLDSQLSAFLDDELPGSEADLLIRRLERDCPLRQAFARYALIGEVMRCPAAINLLAGKGFAANVSHAIAAEGSAAGGMFHPQGAFRTSRWLKAAAGLAIAAGVAGLAVGILTTEDERPRQTATSQQIVAPALPEGAGATATEASYIVPEITVTGPLLPGARLTNYVMAHSEYSSPLGRRNVLSSMLADDAGVAADDIVPTGFVPAGDPLRLAQP